MTIQQAAKEINNKLAQWSKGRDKLVVAIDGYTGVGKTTLLKRLAELNNQILPVNRDDFQISRTKFESLIKNKKNRSRIFELEMNDSVKLEKLVRTFRKSNMLYKIKAYDGVTGKIIIPKVHDLSKKIMVIEGIFLFHPKLLNHILDRRIYLEGHEETIDKRRIAREKKRWGKDYFPEDHADSYFRQVIIAQKRYIKLYKPKEQADLVLHID